MPQDYKFIAKPDYEKISNEFCKELQQASQGEKNQLLFLKTYLPPKPIITSGLVQVAVMGGTNYDFAVVEINEGGKKHIQFREKGKLPAINSIETFVKLLDTHLSTNVNGIVLNLGFPLNYFKGEKGQPDGMLIKATKEHKLVGLLGHKIGEIVLDRYIRKHNSYTVVAVANDVVCLSQDDGGLILGTGFNMGIKGEDEEGTYIVNVEAGNAGAYEATDELETIDKHSMHPGINRFEKMISGSYLYHHFNLLAKKHGIDLHISNSEELSEIATGTTTKAGEIARELFDRSANYVAAYIAGVYSFKGKPEKLTFTVEGSVFHYGYKYQKTLKRGLAALGISDEMITFHSIHDSSLIGALKLLSS